MINQEIEKRFIFDLEMGAFSKDGETMINFHSNPHNISRIICILEKNGYTNTNISSTFYKNFISIDISKKLFLISAYRRNYDEWQDFIDKLPEYLEEYELRYD